MVGARPVAVRRRAGGGHRALRAPRRHPVSRRSAGVVALLGVVAYVPPLLTAPGVVAADTKQYLYLDPGRLMQTATSLWDPGSYGGWVTHQTIGSLWPLGPWYWTLQHLAQMLQGPVPRTEGPEVA